MAGGIYRLYHHQAQPFLSGRCPFFRALHLGIQFSFHPASSLFGTQQHLTYPPVKSSNFPLLKNHVSQGLLFANVLTSSCLGSLCFVTHPYYSVNPYVNLYYLWFISIAKDRRYLYFIICVVYFYSEIPPLCREV